MNAPVICLRIDFRSAAWALLAACSFLMSWNLPAQDGREHSIRAHAPANE